MKTAASVLKTLMCAAALVVLGVGQASAATLLQPYVLAYETTGDLSQVAAQVKQKLTTHGFDVVGSYIPYTNAKFANDAMVSAIVMGVTNKALKQAAAETPYGGFAVVQRVSVTKVVSKDGKSQIQVSYTNPVYMSNVYRMKADLQDVADQLKAALGWEKQYGAPKGGGLTPSALRDYHYAPMMPKFTQRFDLKNFDSYQEALQAVNAGLAAHKGGTTKVYEVSVPGEQETLFGVGISGTAAKCSGDEWVMSNIDSKAIKYTPHLPYGILVKGDKVIALRPKFRIAISAPNLSMMAGGHTFFDIKCVADWPWWQRMMGPGTGGIHKVLNDVVGAD